MHSMFDIFRNVPKPGQVIRLRLKLKSGLFDNNKSAVYFITRLKCKPASDKEPPYIGLAFIKSEYDEYVKRGAKLYNDGEINLPFEFGKYYGTGWFSRGGCVKGMYSRLALMRLFSYKSKEKIDDVFLAVNWTQLNEAMERYKSRREFSDFYSPWARFKFFVKCLFKRTQK